MNTTGLTDVHFRLEGTLRVEPNLAYWAGNAFPVPYQRNSAIWLFGGENLLLDGGGTIDGEDELYTFYARVFFSRHFGYRLWTDMVGR
jgi:galacturan 1,4-alpha-galacturonidase